MKVETEKNYNTYVIYDAQENWSTPERKTMNESAKEARRAYKRKWAKEHPDKVRRYQQNYWEKKARKLEGAENESGEDPGRTDS